MSTLEQTARDFLSRKRIAVAGVSRKGDVAANAIYKKLRKSGYEVFPVNPNAAEVEGDRCYPDLTSISGGVDVVVIATHPEVSLKLVEECITLGIKRVWMHSSFGQGSVNGDAVKKGEESGLTVLPGGCPMMFCEPVDIAHKCMRWFLRITGKEAKPRIIKSEEI